MDTQLSTRWKQLSDQQRQPFLDLEQQDRKRFRPRWIFFAPGSRSAEAVQNGDPKIREFLRLKDKRSLQLMAEFAPEQLSDGHHFSVIMPLGSPLVEEPEEGGEYYPALNWKLLQYPLVTQALVQ